MTQNLKLQISTREEELIIKRKHFLSVSNKDTSLGSKLREKLLDADELIVECSTYSGKEEVWAFAILIHDKQNEVPFILSRVVDDMPDMIGMGAEYITASEAIDMAYAISPNAKVTIRSDSDFVMSLTDCEPDENHKENVLELLLEEDYKKKPVFEHIPENENPAAVFARLYFFEWAELANEGVEEE